MKRVRLTSLLLTGVLVALAFALQGCPSLIANMVAPSQSVQQAIDQAEPGDTIKIMGTHSENVTIDKDNLTLKGEDRATIDGNVTVKADSDALKALKITGTLDTPTGSFADLELDGVDLYDRTLNTTVSCTAVVNPGEDKQAVLSDVADGDRVCLAPNVSTDGLQSFKALTFFRFGTGEINIDNPILFEDKFENSDLSKYEHDITSVWASHTIDYSVVSKDENQVLKMKGGIDNGGGGGHILYHKDLSIRDMTVSTKIKFVEDKDHQNRFGREAVSAGIAVHYQSLAKGYAAVLRWKNNSPEHVDLRLMRMDGIHKSPYRVDEEVLKGPIKLSNFDPTQWHKLQLQVRGQKLKLKVDGMLRFQSIDATYDQGNPGMWFPGSDGSGWALFDDLTVK